MISHYLVLQNLLFNPAKSGQEGRVIGLRCCLCKHGEKLRLFFAIRLDSLISMFWQFRTDKEF